jgi:hypothetical protein
MRSNYDTAIAHAREVWETETVQINEHRTMLMDIADEEGLDRFGDGLRELSTDAKSNIDYFPMSRPSPAFKLVSDALHDMSILHNDKRPGRHDHTSGYAAIATILNEHLFPMLSIEVEENRATKGHLSSANAGSCGAAEYYFADAIKQVNTGRDYGHKKLEVFHDANNEPLGIRKECGECSVVTLKPLIIKGGLLPPGMVVAVDERMNDLKNQTGHKVRKHDEFVTFLVDGPLFIDPLRLGPWALSNPLDRALFAVKGSMNRPIASRERIEFLKRYTLTDLFKAANRIIKICKSETQVPQTFGPLKV